MSDIDPTAAKVLRIEVPVSDPMDIPTFVETVVLPAVRLSFSESWAMGMPLVGCDMSVRDGRFIFEFRGPSELDRRLKDGALEPF